MPPDNKELLAIATPYVEEPESLRISATVFTNALLKDTTEMNPVSHMSLCAALAELLHYLEGYPLYEVRKGFVIKETWKHEHQWLELPDGRILDPIAGKIDDFSHQMPDVYLGDRPEWYQVEE